MQASEPLLGNVDTSEYGCEILDGIGSTEMLHIFLSNRPGQVRYGTTGQAVPGYLLRIVGDDGKVCGAGDIGELQINGPSAAIMYRNNRAKPRRPSCRAEQLVKPKGFVVLKAVQTATENYLKAHIKQALAPYKFPRWIEFVSELPKTATGNIQRFKLRQQH